MKSILEETKIEFIEKKSKFIGYIKPVNTIVEAEKYINNIKNIHKDATHNVFAYKVVENNQEYFKYSDDGEPLNTAGKPMGEIIERLGVINLVIVATRYFGGIRLGAGGLIRNYAKTAKLAILEAKITEYIEKKIILLDYNYDKSSEMENFFIKNNIEIIEKVYNERITIRANVSLNELNELKTINNILVIEI